MKTCLTNSAVSSTTACLSFRAPRMLFILLLLAEITAACLAQKPVSIPEDIEWTWEVRPPHPTPQRPNVLLLGDSISRNYFPQATEDLAGIANVYLMASSTSVADPRLPHQITEFAAPEKVRFRVVHFNNGMHGWGYSEAQYRAAFPSFLNTVRGLVGKHGTLIWATITPVRPDSGNGATNPRIEQRNAIARSVVNAAGIAVDDQHALMMHHRDLYEDVIHFNPAGAILQGDQAAATIRHALSVASQNACSRPVRLRGEQIAATIQSSPLARRPDREKETASSATRTGRNCAPASGIEAWEKFGFLREGSTGLLVNLHPTLPPRPIQTLVQVWEQLPKWRGR